MVKDLGAMWSGGHVNKKFLPKFILKLALQAQKGN